MNNIGCVFFQDKSYNQAINHFEKALCIVGMSSSILFEMTFTGIPIVIPKIGGVKLYEGIKNVKGMSFPYSINGNIIIVDAVEELKDKIEHKGLKFSHNLYELQ